jgi:SWI/SNF-related matrix-associated actin-dependent regulator 1 of chromatin subfamily A
MNFILPGRFAGALESLRAIFKVKGDSKVTLLSQERISRAKKMMTPFVLRRKKDQVSVVHRRSEILLTLGAFQVLKDLPRKTERIEWCEMTDLQRSIYTDVLQRSHKTILEGGSAVPAPTSDLNGRSKLARNKSAKSKNRQSEKHTSVNVLMDLRKAASHPMLFRTLFTDQILTNITKQLMKEPHFKKRDVNFGFVKEDMEVMTDAELQVFCTTYKVHHYDYLFALDH